jgi:hypothetical protein
VDSTCLAARLRTLVETPRLDLGTSALPRVLLRALYDREYGDSTPAARFHIDATTPPRELFLRALLEAHLALDQDKPFDNDRCLGDAVTRLLCRDGFREMLGRVAADSGVHAMLDSTPRGPECAPENWLDSPARCDASQSLLAFVDNPERFMASKIGLMLHQTWRVEQARRQAGEPAWTNVATLSEALYQSGIGYRYRRGIEPNTSSVPRGSGRGWFATLVPNYATVSLFNAAFEVGYRPTLHLGRSFAVGLTAAPLHVTGGSATSIDRMHFVIGPTLHWKRSSAVLSGLETGVEYFGNWRRRSEPTVWAIPVTAYLLADKLRIGFRLLPGNHSEVHGGKKVALTFGIADLNGLVYWMLRKS